jgi:hypothetical protein
MISNTKRDLSKIICTILKQKNNLNNLNCSWPDLSQREIDIFDRESIISTINNDIAHITSMDVSIFINIKHAQIVPLTDSSELVASFDDILTTQYFADIPDNLKQLVRMEHIALRSVRELELLHLNAIKKLNEIHDYLQLIVLSFNGII